MREQVGKSRRVKEGGLWQGGAPSIKWGSLWASGHMLQSHQETHRLW